MRCIFLSDTPTGDAIQVKHSFKYLGSMLSSNGLVGTELSCRLGAARKEFDNLCRVWSHASLPKHKKLRIYDACVVSKLNYSLETVYLNAAEVRKLDAFHHRCLRRICISRVSNEVVRATLHTKPLKHVLLKRQLLYFGSLAARPRDNVRNFVFTAEGVSLKPLGGQRQRGRPRANWTRYLHKVSLEIAREDASALATMWAGTPAAKSAWARAVTEYC